MRILVDYRPALRARTGVGEVIHELVRAYTAAATGDEVLLFTSSWKDRPPNGLGEQLGARVVDRRVPVRILNYAWHRLEWPPIEQLAGPVDVAHSAHPLLIPAANAAQVITIHDLFFLSHALMTEGEVRRDYAALVTSHARRAHAVVTPTQYVRHQIVNRLGVSDERVYVCPWGAPTWRTIGQHPNVPADGCILFLGTLEPRKNVGALLDAYGLLVSRRPDTPRLVLAGRATNAAADWLSRIARAPLAGRVTHLGYVPEAERESLYRSARLLVMPSLDEGFGLPVLEAMAAGVPVVASRRGALPEVLGDAGALVEPDDAAALADAIERATADEAWARRAAEAGLERAKLFSWNTSAATLRHAFVEAHARRCA